MLFLYAVSTKSKLLYAKLFKVVFVPRNINLPLEAIRHNKVNLRQTYKEYTNSA
jgi:hypothetical protein